MAMRRVNRSKLRNNGIMLRNKRIRSHIPPTKRFNRKSLDEMLRRYGTVYLKPVYGLKGIGIMRAEKNGKVYRLRKGTSVVGCESVRSLYRIVRGQVKRKAYLVQKGIRLQRYGGRPFDLRIMLQKNEKRKWEVSGIVGRVAPPNRIVTNRSQGGKCLPATRLLRVSMTKKEVDTYLASLSRLSRRIGRQFQKAYPSGWQYGIDIAIDRNLKPWILEVNTIPAVTPFKMLRDRRMYNRMIYLISLNKRRRSLSGSAIPVVPAE
jgi:hypothetical protein